MARRGRRNKHLGAIALSAVLGLACDPSPDVELPDPGLENDLANSDEVLLEALSMPVSAEPDNGISLCEKYGRAAEQMFAPRGALIADDAGYGLSFAVYLPMRPKGPIEWSCEEESLNIGVNSPRILNAENWPTARANLLTYLKTRGLDADGDGLNIDVGPDQTQLELQAARAANGPLQERLKEIREHEARTAALYE